MKVSILRNGFKKKRGVPFRGSFYVLRFKKIKKEGSPLGAPFAFIYIIYIIYLIRNIVGPGGMV